MDLFNAYLNLVDRGLYWIGKVPGLRVRRRFRFGPFELELRTQAQRDYEETFDKIDAAQDHLAEALDAIDGMRSEFSKEKTSLTQLLEEIRVKRTEYDEATKDLAETKNLLSKDRARLKSILGLGEQRGRLAGFVGGIVASLLATGIWVNAPDLWRWISSLVELAEKGGVPGP